MSRSVQIVEVGARDGLQNESQILSVEVRAELVEKLALSGLKRIEAGAFVSPKWVPAMAGSEKVIEILVAKKKQNSKLKNLDFSVLVPNEKGMELALRTPVKEIALFAACSESFSLKNINCGIEESFQRFSQIIPLANKNKIRVRGYLSTCFACPYEGEVSEAMVIKNVKRFLEMGAYEVSIGDTIGVADPKQVERLFKKLIKIAPKKKLAGHFHDTRGLALANIKAAYDLGINTFDSSLGGLGGCPYAPAASGNVATEDVVYMFEKMGISTGVNLDNLIEVNAWLSQIMKKELPSKVAHARGWLKPKGKVAVGA